MTDIITRYQREWLDAKVKHDQMVANAAETKTHLPDNYWHLEHEARRKLQIAREFIEAMHDE